jgi:pimeloyl-ACP methyl ester carboxylesterase
MKILLLLHGAIGSKDQLEPLSNELQGSFEVHNLNFSGHGGAPFEGEFSIQNFAEEVHHYLNENQLKKVSIFGYSMGGYVALYLALKFPERVEKIVTLATKFSWSPEIASREVNMLNPQLIVEKIPAFAKALKERHLPNNWEEVMHKTGQMMLGLGERQPLSANDFQNIHTPVKLAIGNADKMVTIDETAQVADGLPNSELLILPDVQHPIEKVPVSLLVQEITAFLK